MPSCPAQNTSSVLSANRLKRTDNGQSLQQVQRHRSVREDVMFLTARCLGTVAEWSVGSSSTDMLTGGQTGRICHVD
jgi:hypothetical protein